MSKSIFISCVQEDSHHIASIQKWASNNQLGDNVGITHATQPIDMRPYGYDAILNYIRPKIKGASAILVLLGQNTHNHDWIRAEVELANSYNIKLIVARIPGTTGSAPEILNNKTSIVFDPNSIKKALL